MRHIHFACVLPLVVSAAFSAAPQAHAAFPGNNGRISFVSTRDGNQEIYVMTEAGADQTRLTNHPAPDGEPAWSPDGTRIAFRSDRDNSYAVWVMNDDGSDVRRVTPTDGNHPDWSPDGTRLVYEYTDPQGSVQIGVINVDGTGFTPLTVGPGPNWNPAWSPDGSRIAFASDRDGGPREIYVMNADGSGQMRLTNNWYTDWTPSWSPDGSKIAFARDIAGNNLQIFVMNADGTGEVRLTNNSSWDSDPSWSRDGTRIAFHRDTLSRAAIIVVNADGTGEMELTPGTSWKDTSPDWEPRRVVVVVAFDFEPQSLNLKSKGRWVTGYLRPPAPYAASQIDVASIQLNGVVPVSPEHPATIEDHDTRLEVKFSRAEVKPTLTAGDHVPVTITGTIAGECFSGTDSIKVTAPRIHHPAAGSLIAAGSTTEVTWETASEAPVQPVTLLLSVDGGATWNTEAEGLANTGSYTWTVSNVATNQARLAVVVVYGRDETGVIPEAELAESDAFAIVAPTSVDGSEATFALRVPNPMMGPLTVSFGLTSGAPASLAVYDIGGRRVVSREVGSGGRGFHTMSLGDLAAGVYVVRLSQSGRSLSSRVAVIR